MASEGRDAMRKAGRTVAFMLVSAVLATAAIFHGSPAPLAEIPWFAAMYEDGGPVCGGSLLAPDRVLTAAHCVQGTAPGDYAFRINGTTHEVRGAYFPANYRIIPSPLLPLVYSASASANDIAIAVSVGPSPNLPPGTTPVASPSDGETTLTVGRGITSPA